jgi:hypothetical protein
MHNIRSNHTKTSLSSVLPLTYAIGYATSSSLSRSCKISRLPVTSLPLAVDCSPDLSKVSSKVPTPLLLAPRYDPFVNNGYLSYCSFESSIIDNRQSQRRKSIRADFMQSIRSRLMVFQVVQAIRIQSAVTFDFVILLTIAR